MAKSAAEYGFRESKANWTGFKQSAIKSLPPVIFRQDVLSFEDLKPDMELEGTVRNVVDFGAFVDIGVKTDGLVHISQMSKKFIKHPMDALSVGDTVKVKILEVDAERQKISLTMKF